MKFANRKAFCLNCGEKHPFFVISKTATGHHNDIEFNYDELSAYCVECGKEVYVQEVSDRNVDARNESYAREKERRDLNEGIH